MMTALLLAVGIAAALVGLLGVEVWLLGNIVRQLADEVSRLERREGGGA